MLRTLDLGGAGFVVTPVGYAALVNPVKVLANYWFEITEFVPPARVLSMERGRGKGRIS